MLSSLPKLGDILINFIQLAAEIINWVVQSFSCHDKRCGIAIS